MKKILPILLVVLLTGSCATPKNLAGVADKGASAGAPAVGEKIHANEEPVPPPKVMGTTNWGGYGTAEGQFRQAGAIAMDSDENCYIADSGNDRIQKFTFQGRFILSWGECGGGNGQFKHPTGIAVAKDGSVYVSDTLNHRIQKFDSSGKFLLTWGEQGIGDGQFDNPGALAIDSAGNLFVADTDNHRIQKFDPSGKFLLTWGSQGNGNLQFNRPGGIAVTPDDKVWLADTLNNRLLKFEPDGTFIAKVGRLGNGDGEFDQPGALTADTYGNILVADSGNSRIECLDRNGNLLSVYVSPFSHQPFDRISGLVVNKTNWFFYSNRLTIVNSGYDKVLQHTALSVLPRIPLGSEAVPFALATDASDNLFVGVKGELNIKKYNLRGDCLAQFGFPRTQSYEPFFMTTGPDGSLFVTEINSPTVWRFDADGKSLPSWRWDPKKVYYAGGIAVDSNGVVCISNPIGTILRYTSDGSPLASYSFVHPDNRPVEFRNLTFDGENNLFAYDTRHDEVAKFDSTGNFIKKWDVRGTDKDYWDKSWGYLGMSCDEQGTLYICNQLESNIRAYTNNGSYLGRFGSYGYGPGQMVCPAGIVVTRNGTVAFGQSSSSELRLMRI